MEITGERVKMTNDFTNFAHRYRSYIYVHKIGTHVAIQGEGVCGVCVHQYDLNAS